MLGGGRKGRRTACSLRLRSARCGERVARMPKFRHLAIVCKDPAAMAEWYEKAFDLKRVRQNPKNGVTELTDGDFHLVLLAETFLAHDPVPWHFGLEMTLEEIEERRPLLESMGC